MVSRQSGYLTLQGSCWCVTCQPDPSSSILPPVFLLPSPPHPSQITVSSLKGADTLAGQTLLNTNTAALPSPCPSFPLIPLTLTLIPPHPPFSPPFQFNGGSAPGAGAPPQDQHRCASSPSPLRFAPPHTPSSLSPSPLLPLHLLSVQRWQRAGCRCPGWPGLLQHQHRRRHLHDHLAAAGPLFQEPAHWPHWSQCGGRHRARRHHTWGRCVLTKCWCSRFQVDNGSVGLGVVVFSVSVQWC